MPRPVELSKVPGSSPPDLCFHMCHPKTKHGTGLRGGQSRARVREATIRTTTAFHHDARRTGRRQRSPLWLTVQSHRLLSAMDQGPPVWSHWSASLSPLDLSWLLVRQRQWCHSASRPLASPRGSTSSILSILRTGLVRVVAQPSAFSESCCQVELLALRLFVPRPAR